MRLSVAMCTYNGEAYLPEQLESIAAQTRLPDELIICDDRSRDATAEIVREFAARAPFPVRLAINPHNIGSTRNFEQALRLCEGEVIALSDQDDVWKRSKLARLEAIFDASPHVGLVFTDAEVVSADLQSLGYRLWERVGFDAEKQKMVRDGRAVEVLLTGWIVTGATMALRAKFRELALPIPTNLPMIHDGWLALLVACVAEVSFVDTPLVKYRQHSRQQIGAPENKSATDETGARLSALAVRSALRRANAYAELIEIITVVRRRLATQGGELDSERALHLLDSMATHLAARSRLPESVVVRASVVLRELLSLRYHRYSNGVRSATKDLIARGAQSSSES
jgi:glycosyltransferase involved in cell wall biosynthesis